MPFEIPAKDRLGPISNSLYIAHLWRDARKHDVFPLDTYDKVSQKNRKLTKIPFEISNYMCLLGVYQQNCQFCKRSQYVYLTQLQIVVTNVGKKYSNVIFLNRIGMNFPVYFQSKIERPCRSFLEEHTENQRKNKQ